MTDFEVPVGTVRAVGVAPTLSRSAPCDSWPMTCWTPPEDEATAELLWEAACETVWAVTGRRVGICEQRAWFSMPGPIGENCLPVPLLWRGRWYNVPEGPLPECCKLTLPGPVDAVTRVEVDGVAFTGYRLVGDILVTTSGLCWPPDVVCGVPRIYVEWRAGRPVPTVCLLAAAEVATELAKACNGDVSCRLPSNVVALVRQGISLNFVDPAVLVDAGLWGLARVDAAIRALNPAHLPQRSAVYSPDAPRMIRA